MSDTRFDHDGTWRHHHHYATNEPIWWENVEEFGGEKRHHVHQHRPTVSDPTLREELVDELALVIAKARTKGSVYMNGSHNPLPSERIAASQFMDIIVANAAALATPDSTGDERLQQERDRIAAAVRELDGHNDRNDWPADLVYRAAVLAAIEGGNR